ncbi:hypothetical protein GCM10009564_33930 [Streptomyces thermogriseus]|uniref:Uncharacterized protein n=1 Tax=Streptomyces thermogriseus TaxID=75292 RepID=A0ABN1T1L9_9ACTN
MQQEEPDAPAGLVAHPGPLAPVPGAGGQQGGAGAVPLRCDDDPARAVRARGVLDRTEAERLGVVADRLVVVVDDEGDQGDASHRSLSGLTGAE